MSAHVTEAELQVALGANAETAFTGAESVSNIIAMASALVDARLLGKGYTPPATSTGDESGAVDFVKAATIGYCILMLYGKQGVEPPKALASAYTEPIAMLTEQDMQVPGMTPSSETGVGGTQFTDSSTTTTGAKPKIFGGLRERY